MHLERKPSQTQCVSGSSSVRFWWRPTCHAALPQKPSFGMLSKLASNAVQNSSIVKDDEVSSLPFVSKNVVWPINFPLQAVTDAPRRGEIIYDLDAAISRICRTQRENVTA